MSTLVGIVGPPGSGKSTSIETLDPKSSVIINVANKPLPFRGYKTNYKEGKLSEGANLFITNDSPTIVAGLKYISDNRKEIKNVVLDDVQYVAAFEFMARSKETGFAKFNDIAKNIFEPINSARGLRDDLTIFYLWHDETIQDNYAVKRKMKTLGKLVDDKVSLEGLFTIVLFTDVKTEKDKFPTYSFITQTDGSTTAKSPKGMFETLAIPNDLKLVSDKINEYYN